MSEHKKQLLFSCFILWSFFFGLTCCKDGSAGKNGSQKEEAIVRVFGETLYAADVKEAIPKGISKTDSLLTAEAFVKNWINERLVYEKARRNISDKDKIDEMVENYRRTLVMYSYQQDLVNQKLPRKISDEELKTYYDANKDKLFLSNNLVKGLFLKIPLQAPQKEELLKWYKSSSDEAIEHIEKYSLKNAVTYDYFLDKWKEFSDIASKTPGTINDSREFLMAHNTYETRDKAFIYLLHIKDYKLAGSVPPFEYVKAQIADLIINQRKEEFLRKFETDIYKKALDDKDISFFKEGKVR